MTWRLGTTLALSAWVAALGCGPIEYMSQVTRKAATAVEAARQVGAERLAPYEYTGAVEYLHKAREVASHAQYQIAIEYGRRSEELAAKARDVAVQRAREPAPPAPAAPPAPGSGP